MSTERLYRVVSTHSEQNHHQISIKLNYSHPVYKGHFPDLPVLPGVCTLQIIRECAGMILNRNIYYKTISQSKFTSMIVPNGELVELSITLGDNDTLLTTVQVKEKTMLKLKSTFTDI